MYYRHLSLYVCVKKSYHFNFVVIIDQCKTELNVNSYCQSSQADLPTLIADRPIIGNYVDSCILKMYQVAIVIFLFSMPPML